MAMLHMNANILVGDNGSAPRFNVVRIIPLQIPKQTTDTQLIANATLRNIYFEYRPRLFLTPKNLLLIEYINGVACITSQSTTPRAEKL
jgi:hypothetical protein